jgi:hypothetical protein
MLTVQRVVGILLFFMAFLVLKIGITTAKPSKTCRHLAKQFAERPEKLSDDSLAELRTCLTDELKIRHDDEKRPVPQPKTVPPVQPPRPPQPGR